MAQVASWGAASLKLALSAALPLYLGTPPWPDSGVHVRTQERFLLLRSHLEIEMDSGMRGREVRGPYGAGQSKEVGQAAIWADESRSDSADGGRDSGSERLRVWIGLCRECCFWMNSGRMRG